VIAKLRYWWQEVRSSFWFVPAVIVLGAVGLATVLIAIDVAVELPFVDKWPLLFGTGADGARGLLTTVASAMITVAGVVFSITIVALSLTSSQYTSRVLRNFMRDRINQGVLGVFVGIFAYCLVVLRAIRGGDEGAFLPVLAVLVGLILSFVGIAFLIFFIHHISVSIQASSIVAEVTRETIAAVDQLFPRQLNEDSDEDTDKDLVRFLTEQAWSACPARETGYIESVNADALLALARDSGTIVRMEHGIGEFVIEGAPLISIADQAALDEKMGKALNAAYVISEHRTVQQDVGFGIRQLVDIALKALSPGINDTTTAVMCVDYLTAIFVRLADRRITMSHRLDQGELRVIVRGTSFESLLAEAFDGIRQNAKGNVAVLLRMLEALQTIASQAASPQRRWAVGEQVQWIAELAERTIDSRYDRERFESRLACVREALLCFQHKAEAEQQ
jgi:uncharacterized membrane protein